MNEMIRRAAWLALAGILALALGFAQAPVQQAAPEVRLDELIKRMRTTIDEYWDKNWNDDLTSEQQQELIEKRPGREFVPEFEALALEAKGTDVAATALMEVLTIQCDFQEKPAAEKTLQRLMSDSIQSKALERLPSTLMNGYSRMAGMPATIATLETLLEKSPHKSVQASALFTLGRLECAGNSDEQRARGRKRFERLIAEFGDIKGNGGTYKAAAEGFLFEFDHLQVGMVAPDFESIDENGTKFKLSDYRGKVTVLDFWGNW